MVADKASGAALLADANTRIRELLRADAQAQAVEAEAGYLDLLDGSLQSTGPTQDLMLTRLVPAIYERWWRPALSRIAKGVTGPGTPEEMRIARLLLAISDGDRVLDVACGPGNFSRAFAKATGPQGLVVGLDASETMLSRACRDTAGAGIGGLGFVAGDATAMPFDDDSFDGVCCFLALHLFPDPLATLSEAARVLVPGGRIAIMTSVRRSVAHPLAKPAMEKLSGMRLFEADEITTALRIRGFTDINQRLSGMIQIVGGRLEI